MRYKQGDRVRIRSKEWYESNKNKFGKVWTRSLTGDYMICFDHDFVKYCGKVAEIFSVERDNYALKGIPYAWTDEMIEGLAEYPKIAIQGDPTRGVSVIDALIALGGENEKDVIASTKHACYFIDHDGKIRSRLLDNIPEGFKLYTLDQWEKQIAGKIKVGDVFYSKYLKGNVLVKGICNGGFYLVESNKDGTSWKVDSDDLEVVKDKPAVDAKEVQKVLEEINDMEKNELLLGMVKTAKGQELIPHKDYEIKQDNEKFYLVKKKKEYPKTYEECCYVLGFENTEMVFEDDYRDINPPKEQWKRLGLMNQLNKLLICRDAYWKISGEEMGLGKPWEPDWDNVSDKYCIYFVNGDAWSKQCQTRQCPFAFPTPEMRDAFKKNFDPDIENCKELL